MERYVQTDRFAPGLEADRLLSEAVIELLEVVTVEPEEADIFENWLTTGDSSFMETDVYRKYFWEPQCTVSCDIPIHEVPAFFERGDGYCNYHSWTNSKDW